jgi:hypothetical protein
MLVSAIIAQPEDGFVKQPERVAVNIRCVRQMSLVGILFKNIW